MSASPSLAPPAPMSHHSPSPRPTSASTPKFTPNHPRPLVHPHLDSRSNSASPRQAQDEDRNHDPRHSLHSSFSSNESPWQSSRVSVRALTEMAGPSTPVSMSAAAAAAGLVALNGAKSRKSSCDLCHHRKIKCDRIRPACSSCLRKGQICRFSEETEQNNPDNPGNRLHARASTVTIVSATDPGHRVVLPVPNRPAQPNLLAKAGPEWSSRRTSSMSGRVERSLWGCDEKGKITERRERIAAGFDSDSEAEMVKTEPVDVEREQEQDELDSGEEREKDSSPGPSEKKRDASPDDDVSGEVSSTQQDTADEKLLELASGPPKKKNKPFAPAPATTPVFRHPKPFLPRNNVGPRSSLPATLQNASPTPNTSLSHLPARLDPYTTPLQSLIASLPSTDIQAILFNAVFTDPLLTEGVSLLQPQFQEDFRGMLERRNTRLREGDATTLANAFAFLAVALRILPKETSDLLLASTLNVANGGAWTGIAQPRSLPRIISPLPPAGSDPTPLDQRYFDLALLAGQIAEQSDSPSVMLIMLKLVLYRYCMIRRDRLVLASGWLAQAVKVAQALGMGKEWEGIPLSERELRRRVMWSLYVADRHHSFETSCPYTILDAHQGIHLPSPCSEADLYKLGPDRTHLPPHSTELGPTACTALFIHTHLARHITPILDSFATVSPANTPHELLLRFDASLDAFQDALPGYFRLFPLTDTRFDSTHPYLAPHRVRLHSTLLAYRSGVHRTHLTTYLVPTTPIGIRQVIAQVCLSSLRVQRSAKMLDAKIAPRLFSPITVFESASTLALIMHVEKVISTAAAPTPEHFAMRAGVAEGIELLDNVLNPPEGTFARKAMDVLRALMRKVDASKQMNGHPPDRTRSTSPKHPLTSPAMSASEAKPNGITVWLEGLSMDGVNLEYIVRDPKWEDSWERAIISMRTEGFHRGEE